MTPESVPAGTPEAVPAGAPDRGRVVVTPTDTDTDTVTVTVTVNVNGEAYEAAAGTTVADLVSGWCPSPRGVAVAVDGDIVARSTWGTTLVGAGAAVEIVTAAAGG